jgi:hypothetical protein
MVTNTRMHGQPPPWQRVAEFLEKTLEMKAKDLPDWWDMVQDMFQEDLKVMFQKLKLDENM